MRGVPKKEVMRGGLENVGALLKKHDIEALVLKHKPQGLPVSFNVEWLDNNASAA